MVVIVVILFNFFVMLKCKLFCFVFNIFVGSFGLVVWIIWFICCRVSFVVVSFCGEILILIFFLGVL